MLVARLHAGEQALAVVGCEEFAERLDAADDQQQVVLAFAVLRKHRIDEIVARALLAELDLEAVDEEGRAEARLRASLHGDSSRSARSTISAAASSRKLALSSNDVG